MAEKILNAEVDVRSYFSTFDFPKLPEVIQAIETVFSADITKVVKALRGPLMGVYRIQATDYDVYKDKQIVLRGQSVPVILRTPQERSRKDGILVTIYDSFNPEFQYIEGKAFDELILGITGVAMIRQTTPQFYKGTRVLNGNRYFVADFDIDKVDLGDSLHVGGAQFKLQYTGMQRFCFLCNIKHGTQCKAKEAFERMKEQRKDKLTHKIYSDSSLRHVNQLALAANVACTSGGGIGQIVNAINVDPERKEKVVIFAGVNEIRHSPDNSEFTYTIQKEAEKLHSLAKYKKVTLVLPTLPLGTIEEKARFALLKETMSDVKSITVAEILHPIEYDNIHPTVDGTKAIIGSIEEELEEQLILETEHVTTVRRYSQVQALYKMGCRACESKRYTKSLCDSCLTAAKDVDITRITTLISEITSSEFPPPDGDAEMNDPNKRGINDDEENKEIDNKAKRQNFDGAVQ